MKIFLTDEMTSEKFEKTVAEGDYKNTENIAKGVARGLARKLIRNEWINSGKLIIGDDLLGEEFASGYDSLAMKKEVEEREKRISWEIDEA